MTQSQIYRVFNGQLTSEDTNLVNLKIMRISCLFSINNNKGKLTLTNFTYRSIGQNLLWLPFTS